MYKTIILNYNYQFYYTDFAHEIVLAYDAGFFTDYN